MNAVEIEFDLPNNNQVFFPPLGAPIRGRWDLGRVKEPAAMAEEATLGRGYPSQRLRLDYDKCEGEIIDPLYDQEYRDVRLHIEHAQKKQIPKLGGPVRANVSTWHYWMRSLVDQQIAKVVKGQFMDTKAVVAKHGEPARSQFSAGDSNAKQVAELREQIAELRGMVMAMTASKKAG